MHNASQSSLILLHYDLPFYATYSFRMHLLFVRNMRDIYITRVFLTFTLFLYSQRTLSCKLDKPPASSYLRPDGILEILHTIHFFIFLSTFLHFICDLRQRSFKNDYIDFFPNKTFHF